ncbi:predicted protein, partial [Nematostella vectensis]
PPPLPCGSPKALGFENKEIPDASLSASSSINRWHGPNEARLNLKAGVTGVGAWCARDITKDQHLEVDLGTSHVITHVATQGIKYPKFVKSYKLYYSQDGNSWKKHPVQYRGNIDTSTVTKNTVFPSFIARYVRINPTSWESSICLRAEIYGCPGKRI